MQLNVFYTLHEQMQSIDIGYFDLTLDIMDAFETKRGDIKERAEQLVIVHFKTKGLGRQPKYGGGKLLVEPAQENLICPPSCFPRQTISC